jgi:hypothetical protein
MEARFCRLLIVLAALSSMGAAASPQAFRYKTRNFVVTAPTADIARLVGDAAEVYRKEISLEWLGQELLPWYQPCPVLVKVGQIGAGGQTTFSFHPSPSGRNEPDEVTGWDMRIQGSLERILDSVLPHEISHTIFACHFRRPLPRWADEGAATLIEHETEKRRQVMTVRQVIGTRRRIPLQTLLTLKEYPRDMQDVMTLYAEGYSLAELLVQQGGKARYLKFINDGEKGRGGWEKAIQSHYGYRGVEDLEKHWHEWIIAGSPDRSLPEGQLLVLNDKKSSSQGTAGYQLRGQSPEVEPVMEDPFLDVASNRLARSPGINQQKVGSPPRAPVRSAGQRAAPHEPAAPPDSPVPLDRDWTPEDEDPRVTISSGAASPDDDGTWVDVPRPRPRLFRRNTQERPAASSNRSAGETTRQPESRPDSPKALPSVVRQQQARGRRGADEIEPSGTHERTPWSEFPADGLRRFGGRRD